MVVTYEIYQRSDSAGYAYRVLADGVVCVNQQYAPGVAGFVPMTQAEAQSYADADVATLSAEPVVE